MLAAGGAADVVAALVFAVTLVGSYALCASAAGTAPQNAAIGVERGADRRPAPTRTCSSPPRKTGTRCWPGRIMLAMLLSIIALLDHELC